MNFQLKQICNISQMEKILLSKSIIVIIWKSYVFAYYDFAYNFLPLFRYEVRRINCFFSSIQRSNEQYKLFVQRRIVRYFFTIALKDIRYSKVAHKFSPSPTTRVIERFTNLLSSAHRVSPNKSLEERKQSNQSSPTKRALPNPLNFNNWGITEPIEF